MTKKEKEILIIGGGPTGLAIAYHFAQKGIPFILLEKEPQIGGLSATFKRKDFHYELGPHALHLSSPEMNLWMKKMLGADFRVIPTVTQVYIDGKTLSYPLKMGEVLFRLSPILSLRILISYFKARLGYFFDKGEIISFEDWGVRNFGKLLYKISFGDYTEKVWGISPSKISANLASQKLARLSFSDIIKKLLGFKGKDQPAYFKKYLYPQEGAGLLLEKIYQQVKKKGKILLDSKVVHLKRRGEEISAVEYLDSAGSKKILYPESVISTITIKDLAPLVNDKMPRESLRLASELRFRDLVIIYLVINKVSVSLSQWTYLVENKFTFNRYTEGRNLSRLFAPRGKTVLSFEKCCFKNDSLWKKKDEEILSLLKKDLSSLGLESLIIEDYFVRRIENAYPMFLLGYDETLNQSLRGFSEIDNLYITGRNGLFLNIDITDSLRLGFETAEAVTNNVSSRDWYQKAGLKWLKN